VPPWLAVPDPSDTNPHGSAPPPRPDWAGRALRALLVGVVAAAAGWLLAPGAALRLPGGDALGSPAALTIKADRDYDIVDAEATARRRAEAAATVQPVYDHEDGAAEEAAARVHAAFELMRDEERLLAAPAEAAELDRRFAAQRDAFVARLQLVVRDSDFRALAAARFSSDVERELTGLARRGLNGMVVEDLKLLPAQADDGFVVRTFRGGSIEGERVVLDRALIRDVAAARAEVVATAAARLEKAPPALRAAVLDLATAMVRPTLVHAQGETERRRVDAAARVKPVVVPVKRGEKIIGDGERIEARHLVVFDGMRAQRKDEDVTHVRLGGGAIVALLVVLLWRFARRNVPRFRPARRDALLLAVVMVMTLSLGALGFTVADALHERFSAFPPPSLSYVVPFAAGAMIVRQVLSADAALLFSLGAGLAGGLLAGQSLAYGLFATLTSLAAASVGQGGRDRTGLFRAGLGVGAVGAAVVVTLGLYGGKTAAEVTASAAAALAGGALLLPVVVVGFLPVVEGVFGYVTDVKLLELANLNHPALKELIVQAPGTYHHSIVMGSLVEAAAQAVGANPLLARVCAYYHDLGKIRNPLYYAENQRGENKHDALAASMSSLIVKRHVTDGLELARHWRLPRPVQDAIPQHHGTRHVGYFWAKAQRAAEEGSSRATVLDEALFRYPGPKPQTREAALVMIADACEASSRALSDPTGDALQQLVQKRINEIFSEGQLDECELTLRDLSAIAGAMVRALEAIYHTRPEYPQRATGGSPRPPVQLVAKP
jgi:cyclic-di-AMP phosphodiesterase PgpH